MVIEFVNSVGRSCIKVTDYLGQMALFLHSSLIAALTTRLKIQETFRQALHIGVNSLSVIVLTGISTGGVLAYQSHKGLSRFNGEQFIGPIVFISMVREFGPVLASVMVTGRAGSSMTAEIGTMRITEQIDALQTLLINPQQYLIVPRILATIAIMPFLSLFCSICGIFAGYAVAVYMLGVNPELYMKSIRENVDMFDITSGLIKAVVFGFLLAWIATFKGFTTHGGAKGVGLETTRSVVQANVAIFIADYLLTALMF